MLRALARRLQRQFHFHQREISVLLSFCRPRIDFLKTSLASRISRKFINEIDADIDPPGRNTHMHSPVAERTQQAFPVAKAIKIRRSCRFRLGELQTVRLLSRIVRDLRPVYHPSCVNRFGRASVSGKPWQSPPHVGINF